MFVTVGTDHHPFDRLGVWIDQAVHCLPSLDVHMQTGTSRLPQHVAASPYLTYEQMRQRLLCCDVVVCHGGPATIIEARASGHKPIVVPRHPDLGEHVDGHQMRFAQWMHDRGQVLLAQNPSHLTTLLRQVVTGEMTLRGEAAHATHPDGVASFPALVSPLLRAG